MDTPQRIGAIVAVALVVAFCTISDRTRYDVESKMASDIQALRAQLDSLETQLHEVRGETNRIRILLAAQADGERIFSALDELPFLSTLSDGEVSAITEVLTAIAPEAWPRELEEETALSETQIRQLLEALEAG